jgi:hypothetical protein
MSKPWFYVLSKLRPKAAARYMVLRAFDEHTFHVCSACVSDCPLGEDGDVGSAWSQIDEVGDE